MSKKSKNGTLVTFLLDRSGSMEAVKSQTIEAFNAYLDGLQKEKDAKILFTFLQFDTQSLDKVCVRTPVKTAPHLNEGTFQPRGGTPLIDAAYKTIKAVEESLKGDTKTKVTICIQTDGEENSSMEHDYKDLTALIKEKQALGWEFIFMGAGIDAYAQATAMGIAAQNTMSYGKDRQSTVAAFASAAFNTTGYAAGRMANTSFTASQRNASGDAFYKNRLDLGGAAPRHTVGVVQTQIPVKPKKGTVDDITL